MQMQLEPRDEKQMNSAPRKDHKVDSLATVFSSVLNGGPTLYFT